MDSTESAHGFAAAESLSCKICRRRKVKCDKRYPCAGCQKSNVECVFPQGRRRPTQGRTSRDTELLHRLKHLESELHALRTSVHKSKDSPTKTLSPANSQNSGQGYGGDVQPDNGSLEAGFDSVGAEFGRLDIRQGRSRYTSNALWASLSQEISDMQELLDEDTSDDDSSSSPSLRLSSLAWGGHSGLLLGMLSNDYSTSTIHPTQAQMLILWSIFEQNVMPVASIFHGSTTKALLESAASGAEAISTTNEIVLFSVYYAAVVSLQPEKCQTLLGDSQNRLMKKYRHGLEQSLCRVDFLNSSTFTVLQGFTLFALCVRRHDDTRLMVSWCATATRIAQSLGLHRDGSKFGLDPFQTEMRRRVWWHLVLLDADSARDHGIDPLLHESSFDTRMPLNVNDNDIYPEMPDPPVERQGFTDMTHCIARFEVCMVFRRLCYAPPRMDLSLGGYALRTLQEKESIVREVQERLDETYLQHCEKNQPLQFATAVSIRSACAMLWSIIYHPLQRKTDSISQDMHDQLFGSMVDVIENTRLLECNPATAQWGWYFHNDVQWSAIAYVLNELLTRPPGPSVSRAWRVIDAARRQWDADASPLQKGMLWRAVKAMTVRAGLREANSVTAASHIPMPPEHPLPGATCATQNTLKVHNNYCQEDPWLLLGEESDFVNREALPELDELGEKATRNWLNTSSMNETFQGSSDAHQNSWWSLLNCNEV